MLDGALAEAPLIRLHKGGNMVIPSTRSHHGS